MGIESGEFSNILAGNKLEKVYEDFMQKADEFINQQKVPVWFKPFLDMFRQFTKEVLLSMDELQSDIAVQKKVTDNLCS